MKHQCYTARRVYRPLARVPFRIDFLSIKIGFHEGVLIRGPNDEVLVWRGYDAQGRYQEIVDPIVHFTHDLETAQIASRETFLAGETQMSVEERQHLLPADVLFKQLNEVQMDTRSFKLFERDCSTTANTILNAPGMNAQLKDGLLLIAIGIGFYHIFKRA